MTPLVATMDPGDTETFTAVVLDLLGQLIADAPVVWSAAGAGTITADGTFRAGDDPSGGTAAVRATSGGVLGTASVVIEPRVATRIAVSPQTVTAAPGDHILFAAQVFDQDGKQLSNAVVRWSVSGSGSIDATGRYSAPMDPAGGVAQVTATSEAATASASVTIEPDAPADPDLMPGL